MAEMDPRDARIAQLEAELAEARATIAELKQQWAEALATIAELRARLGQTSRNSNKPPSSDGPGVKRERKEPTGRKPGGQPGHKGHRRELLPPEKVDEVVAVRPKGCSRCGAELEQREDGPTAWRHQVLTAVTTLQQQQRNVLDYLTAAMHAHLHGQAPPSLLPGS